MTNQNLVRKLRLALNTNQQVYFCRVFFFREDANFVRREMDLSQDFESLMLKSLRT